MSFADRAGGALLAAGLAATMGIGSYWSAHSLQSTLADQARLMLETRALAATVQFDGRDATVWASSPVARDQAVAALLTIPGVRVVVAGDGTPPENASAGSTVTVTRAAPPSSSSAPTGVTATPTMPAPTTSSPTPTATPPAGPSSTASPTPTASATATATATASTPVWGAILFEGGTSTLDAADKAELLQIAQFMVAHPAVKAILTGHTDLGRTEAERQALGLARAKAAATYLTSHGVAAGRITTLSRGGHDPVASNSTAAGRAANRRVAFVMTQES